MGYGLVCNVEDARRYGMISLGGKVLTHVTSLLCVVWHFGELRRSLSVGLAGLR